MATSRPKRRAIPEADRETHKAAITAPPALDDGGKKNPAKLGESGVKELTEEEKDKLVKEGKQVLTSVSTEGQDVTKRYYVPITKINKEEQTITGVVLQPEIVDAQGDIIGADVISKAAHEFLAGYNAVTKLGLMHKDFKPQFELYESYIVPIDTVIGGEIVKAGSWVIVVHILAKKIWDQVKAGKLTGFSIGGKAKVAKITPNKAA